jgi:hypothetical protein
VGKPSRGALIVGYVGLVTLVAFAGHLLPAHDRVGDAAGVLMVLLTVPTGLVVWSSLGTGLPVTPMLRSHGTVATGPVRGRIERSLLLRDVPLAFPELAVVYREHWQDAGLRVQERTDPPALRALDPQGYELLIEPAPGPFGETVLQVLSPPRLQLRFTAGWVAGVLTAVAVLALGHVDSTDSGGFAVGARAAGLLDLASLGVVLGAAVVLIWPSTRAFGVGFCLPVALAVAAVLTVI